MIFRPRVKPAEQNQPAETKYAGDDERRTPTAERVINPQHQKGRDGSANRRAAVKKGYGPTALAFGEPFSHGFRRTRPIARFARAEQKTEKGKAFF